MVSVVVMVVVEMIAAVVVMMTMVAVDELSWRCHKFSVERGGVRPY
jgi:hypothetical protein